MSVRVCLLVDRYPERSETFVTAEAATLRRLGLTVRVEAADRGEGGDAPPDVPARHRCDDSRALRAACVVWLAACHPAGCVRDLRSRVRWRREEPVGALRMLAPVAWRLRRAGVRHLHAHFAAGAALDALRLGRVLDLPVSVTAHAYDIYAHPRNLREKLERAAFATSGCTYTVDDLRRLAPGARVERIVMGVDAGRLRRTAPLPGGRTVLAMGRLVEKKGFAHLIAAFAVSGAQQLVIAGDGPLRAGLEALAERLAVRDAVHFVGAYAPDGRAELLQQADLLAMPCVIAADGDRDSMPVVVKEAMAMGLPVVASDLAGLPEIVGRTFGRLVAPGDEAALAGAIDELLDAPFAEREAMGRAAREHVIAHADLRTETRRLATLIEETVASRAPGRSRAAAPSGAARRGGRRRADRP